MRAKKGDTCARKGNMRAKKGDTCARKENMRARKGDTCARKGNMRARIRRMQKEWHCEPISIGASSIGIGMVLNGHKLFAAMVLLRTGQAAKVAYRCAEF